MATDFIAQIEIRDPAQYELYPAGFDRVFDAYRGEVVAVDDDVRVLEGRWPHGRTVVIRFPDEEALRAWYESPEYRALARHRWRAAEADVVAVAGWS